MTSFSFAPAYPVPERACKLRFTLTEAGTNYVKVWCTAAPDGSELARKLDDKRVRDPSTGVLTDARVKVYEGPGGAENEIAFEPDVGGKYLFTAQEYTKGAAAHGGGYQDSPSSYQSETAAPAASALILTVGNRMTHRLGTGANTAELVVYVWASMVLPTTLAVHGEDTPAIINPSSSLARTAAINSTVQAQVATMVGATVTTILGTISDVINNMLTRWNIHVASAAFHAAPDTENDVAVSFRSPIGVSGSQTSANMLLRKLRNHFGNTRDGEEIGNDGWHAPGASAYADLANMPIAGQAGDAASLYALAGDLYRAYEAHRPSLTYHSAADNTALAVAPPLVLLHRYFFDCLRQGAPTAASTENQGRVTLAQTAGFKAT